MSICYDALGPEGFGVYEVDFDQSPPTFRLESLPPKGLLIPGFVDIHCHGAFGIDFMSATTSDLKVLTERLSQLGYEGYLPTTVTASADEVKGALAKLPDDPEILGFHLEGPFISPEFPGAQPPGFIAEAPLAISEWDEVLEDPRLRIVTLAPERPHALELTARLLARGVIVSMGHTNATYEEARRGYEFGAAHATHTFNAMRGLHHREAGALGYALLNDDLSCELIYDRLHVGREAASLLIKCKPPDKVIAVSDSTQATGLPSGLGIKMWGLDCVTGKKQVRLASNGALAGSAITLLDAFRNLFEDFGAETAIRLCSLNPRRALKLKEVRTWFVLDRHLEIADRIVQPAPR